MPTPSKTRGTIRQAADHALATHWDGTAWGYVVAKYLNTIIPFLTARKRRTLDAITADDLVALVADCRAKGNADKTIQAKLNALKIVWEIARAKKPVPFATTTMPEIAIREGTSGKVKASNQRWWLRPENLTSLVRHLREINQDTLADYVMWTISTGLRLEDSLALRVKHLSSLELSPNAVLIAKEIVRGKPDNALIFSALSKTALERKWNTYAKAHLGESNNRACTVQSLRIAFASLLHRQGMKPEMLRKLMRNTEGDLSIVEYLKGLDLTLYAPPKRLKSTTAAAIAAAAGWGEMDVRKLLRRVA